VFACVHQRLRENGSFRNANRHAERQLRRNVEKDENIIEIAQRIPRIITRKVRRMRFWRTLHTEGMYPFHNHTQHLDPADLDSRLEFCRWINSNLPMFRNILFIGEAHFTQDGVNNTRNSHLQDSNNAHGTLKSNYQHRFSVKV
jgi:hypothetical protein